MSEEAQQVSTLAVIKADPKWERRRQVIEALDAYKLRLDAKLELRERYEAICTQLYSGRSSRITGMPTNHDQFAAQDHFAEMLDEKMELERALAAEDEDVLMSVIGALDERDRYFIEQFFLSDNPKQAADYLRTVYSMSSAQVYKARDAAIDALYEVVGWNQQDEKQQQEAEQNEH